MPSFWQPGDCGVSARAEQYWDRLERTLNVVQVPVKCLHRDKIMIVYMEGSTAAALAMASYAAPLHCPYWLNGSHVPMYFSTALLQLWLV